MGTVVKIDFEEDLVVATTETELQSGLQGH